ncbi:MAG: class I SAM-dependent methyltransferase [Bacteroidales bacterium]|nr:class I SAM-dependent methyltransferase [Bacteroidales bacterium]
MQYESVKVPLGKLIRKSSLLRKLFYLILGFLLLRNWHISRTLIRIRKQMNLESFVLDAGSGFGQYVYRMAKMNKKWKVKGIDISKELIEDCRKFFSGTDLADRVEFETVDLVRFRETARYDLIISIDVLEHIEDDSSVLTNLYNSLKENGFILISTPSDKGGSDVNEASGVSFIGEHVRNGYSIEEIKEKLEKAGFKNIRSRYTYGKPGNLSWKLTMKYPVKMINKSAFYYLILPFYYLVLLPFLVILNIFDLLLVHKSGTGLLVTAVK